MQGDGTDDAVPAEENGVGPPMTALGVELSVGVAAWPGNGAGKVLCASANPVPAASAASVNDTIQRWAIERVSPACRYLAPAFGLKGGSEPEQ